ncbi:serine hydrolase domain-containing protein [Rubrobacter radiotolerans]|uniref:serine hydrolase domain-containing protein n=1 Tax=Rubrobacter radiotolerans TaxID=42256 RepID=UPI002FBD8FE1
MMDAVAGVADGETGRLVAPDTPFYVYSTDKGATTTAAHVLVERGAFDYDTLIADLWPEFGARGKEGATVRRALTHTVGVPGIPAETTPEDLCDWDKMCAVIAGSEPWWEPGGKTAYHAYFRLCRRGDRSPRHRQAHLAGPPGGRLWPASATAWRLRPKASP